MDTNNIDKMINSIFNWIEEHYGTSEKENPSYDVYNLSVFLVEGCGFKQEE